MPRRRGRRRERRARKGSPMTAADPVSALEVPLAEAARQLGLDLDAATRRRLLDYLGLLLRWNATYNLTAVREPAQMLTHHLLDCLAVVGPLRRRLAEAPAGSLLDVGSGGGLPGGVIALTVPGLEVSCVDTVGKKTAFVRQVASELALPQLHALHARVESLPGRFDLITSRAFATLADFCRLSEGRLAERGAWMAMKGRSPDDEIAQLPGHIEVFHVEQLQVPGLDAERCLVWMRRKPS